MTTRLDHMILSVNDRAASIDFYTRILGLTHEGDRAPLSTIRVTPDFTLELGAWGTQGGQHLAFAMSRAEFDAVFARIREAGIEYGDAFDAVGSMRGPGRAEGAHGLGAALYFYDPNRHLIEIRHYERETTSTR
ncbi:MAG TPA: VOC family protein [Candidatus Binatia bacterium]|nr:VOC family protein [Candidatus Binatia bacterium]